MGQHPIEELMKTAMESIKEMVDVNTIVGDAVQTIDGTVIIPVSKVAFGFAAGGGEYCQDKKGENTKFPFAGGSGAGVSINPVAFMVVGRNNTIKMIPASPHAALDRALDNIPNIIEQIKRAFEPNHKNGKESEKREKETIEKEPLKYQDADEDKK
ncbi:MAG TPA: sporulation protein YtfJ [Clostridiaceae bacterium]|nr:sporulation protein YtfJ [Clostridiaceae bacterium]